MGPAGSGKSSVATKYATAAAERGEVGAIFNFDETLSTICLRSAQIGADVRPHVASGMLQITQLDPARFHPVNSSAWFGPQWELSELA